MVRTKSECSGIRLSSKASFKCKSSHMSSSDSGKWKRSGAGNRYCPRETPAWQKEITEFFSTNEPKHNVEEGSTSTTSEKP